MSLKLLHSAQWQLITNLYQWDACRWGFTDANQYWCQWQQARYCCPVFCLSCDFCF